MAGGYTRIPYDMPNAASSSGGPVPTINVDQTVPADQTPQLKEQHLDVASAMSEQTGAASGIANQFIKLQNEIADQTADTTATNAKNDFMIWQKKKLYGDPDTGTPGYADMDGDPHALFQKYDQEVKEKLDSLSKAPDGQSWTTETQNVVNRRLSQAYRIAEIDSLTEYHRLVKKYGDSADDAQIGLAQNAMFKAANFIKLDQDGKADPTSFGLIDAQLHAIQQTDMAKGIRNLDAVYKDVDHQGNPVEVDDNDPDKGNYLDPKGNQRSVTMGPRTKLAIQQDVSSGLTDTITNLIQSKTPDGINKAKAMIAHYQDSLTGDDQTKIQKVLSKGEDDEAAYKLAFQIKGKTSAQMDDMLKDEDPKVRFKARQYATQLAEQDDRNVKLKQDKAFQALTKVAYDMQQSDPNSSVGDFESSPQYQKLIDQVSAPQGSALKNIFRPSKVSDPKAVKEAWDVLSDPDQAAKLTPDKIAMLSKGIGTDQQGSWVTKKLWAAATPSNSQKNQQLAYVAKEMKTQALRLGIVSNDSNDLTKIVQGGPNDTALGDLQTRFGPILDSMGNPSNEQIDKKINQFLLQEKQNAPSFFQRHFGGGPEKLNMGGSTPSSGPQSLNTGAAPPSKQTMTYPEARAAVIREYKTAGKLPPGGDQLDKEARAKMAQ